MATYLAAAAPIASGQAEIRVPAPLTPASAKQDSSSGSLLHLDSAKIAVGQLAVVVQLESPECACCHQS